MKLENLNPSLYKQMKVYLLTEDEIGNEPFAIIVWDATKSLKHKCKTAVKDHFKADKVLLGDFESTETGYTFVADTIEEKDASEVRAFVLSEIPCY